MLNLDGPTILKISSFDQMGTPVELIKAFGSRADYEAAVHRMLSAL